jgi:4-amino-4-deoxy-L-arabinose transferase-like glycosyltransferase
MMAISGSIFGWNEFAMRLPGALSGILLVGVVGLLARRLAGDRAGLLAAIIQATLPGFFIQEKMCRADVMTLFFATLAFERFLAWAEAPEAERRTRDLLGMWVAVSLGVLTKGPLCIALLGVGGLAWFILKKEWSLLARMGWLWGFPLAAAIILPWYFLVYRSAGASFLHTNLIDENFRALTDGFEQKRPWHFYFVHVPPVTLPWILALGLVWKVRRARGLGLALAWFAGTFLFLSISQAKRQSYVVYVTASLATTVGILLSEISLSAPGLARRALWGVAALLALAPAGQLFLPRDGEPERIALIRTLFPLLSVLLVTGAAFLAGVTWRRGPLEGTLALAGVVLGGFLLYGYVLESRWEDEGRDGKAFCLRVRERIPPGTGLGRLGLEDGAYHFYYGAPIPLRHGEPGPYLLGPRSRDQLLASGRRFRELDRVLDSRKRPTVLAEVMP